MGVATPARLVRPGQLQSVRTLARSAHAPALAGLGVGCVLLAALTWGTWGDLGRDTGYDWLAAARTAGGELPYVDYVYFYGPAAPLLLGAFYALAGSGVGASVALGLALAAAIVVMTYFVGFRLAGTLGGSIAGALAATAAFGSANNAYVLPHSFSAPLAVALALGCVLCVLRFLDGGRRRSLVAAGSLAGLAALSRPETAAALGLALAAWSALRVLRAPAARRDAWRDVGALLGPALALPVVVYGGFAAAVGPRELLFENLYPVDMLDAAGRVVLRGLAPLTAASFAELAGHLVLYAGGFAALLCAGRVISRGGRLRPLAFAAVGAAALAMVAVGLARPETLRYYLQFAYAWIPAGAWVAAGALAWRTWRRGDWSAQEQAPLLVALLLAAMATSAYGAFYPHPRPDGPQATAYAVPLVAAFLVWLHIGLVRKRAATAKATAALGAAWVALLVIASATLIVGDARKESVIVRGLHGAISAPPSAGGAYQGAVDEIERRTAPGDPVLLAPQLTALYVMTGRTDPLRELSLLPGALAGRAGERRAIAAMDGVRLAVTDRVRLKQYGQGAFGATFDRELGAWLRRDFRRVTTTRGAGPNARALDIWVRTRG